MTYKLPFKTLGDLWGTTHGREHAHRGLDFPQKTGTRIKAIAPGTVTGNGFSTVLGFYIIIRDDAGIYWGYNHLAEAPKNKLDSKVRKGQTIGKVGSTGTAATGPHLHLTTSKIPNGNFAGETINPLTLMRP
jgi:hypothetical protein